MSSEKKREDEGRRFLEQKKQSQFCGKKKQIAIREEGFVRRGKHPWKKKESKEKDATAEYKLLNTKSSREGVNKSGLYELIGIQDVCTLNKKKISPCNHLFYYGNGRCVFLSSSVSSLIISY